MTVRSHVSRHYLPLALGMALLLVGTACDEVPYSPSPDKPPEEVASEEVITREVPENKSKSAKEFWTEERMKAAEPATPPQPRSKAGKNSSVPPGPARPSSDREPVQQSGRLPKVTKDDVEDVQELISSSKRGSDPSPVPLYKEYPYSTVGKVFFEGKDGPEECSAAVIKADNRSLVWTAGHCVSQKGRQIWHENWIFVPAYKRGHEPFGIWSAREMATLWGWHVDGNRNYDLAAVKVERKNGQTIASRTGSLGHKFNADRDQEWDMFGYPILGDGLMWECSARFTGIADALPVGPASNAVEKCPMLNGASGGPWVIDFDKCPDCTINSVLNSFVQLGTSRYQSYGTYHGDGARKLHDVAGGL